jgi:hypothetical protein
MKEFTIPMHDQWFSLVKRLDLLKCGRLEEELFRQCPAWGHAGHVFSGARFLDNKHLQEWVSRDEFWRLQAMESEAELAEMAASGG